MDSRKLGPMMDLDTRYLERRTVRGKTGYAWNNRHAAKLGIKSEWLGFDAMVAAQRAHQLNRQYDAAKNGTEGRFERGSLGWWLGQVERMDEHNARPDGTRKEVERSFNRLRASPMAAHQMKVIRGSDIKKVFGKFKDALGVARAHQVIKWLRYALNLAVQETEIAANPMHEMKFERPVARQVIVWEDEVKRLTAHFIEQDLPAIAWAVRFSYDVCQREGDVLRFAWSGWDRGDVLLRQKKTGAIVRVPALPELVEAFGWVTRDAVQVAINEDTGQPFTKEQFSEIVNDGFRALNLVCEHTGRPKLFHDLRRSGIVRLALAGVDRLGISSVSGHSYKTIDTILETYLPRTTAMARLAIQKVLEGRK